MFFSLQNHCADDFSLCLMPILSPWGIDYFSFNIGLPVYFINYYIMIGLNYKLIGTSSIY